MTLVAGSGQACVRGERGGGGGKGPRARGDGSEGAGRAWGV